MVPERAAVVAIFCFVGVDRGSVVDASVDEFGAKETENALLV